MRWIVLSLILATPAAAEEGANPFATLTDRLQSLVDKLTIELSPSLKGIEGWLNDLGAYELPEVLPNGDIIIRRRAPASVLPETRPDGQVDI